MSFWLDDFSGATQNPLVGNWTCILGTTLERISGKCQAVSSAGAAAVWNLANPTANCEVSFTVAAALTAGGLGSYLRFDSAVFNGYALTISNTGWLFNRVVAGVPTVIGAAQTKTIANGTVVKFRIIGNVLSVYWNGVVDPYTQTDATYTTANKAGIFVGSTSDALDNVIISDVAGSGPGIAVPAGVSSTSSLGAAVGKGKATKAVSGVGTTASIGTAVGKGKATKTVSGVGATSSVGVSVGKGKSKVSLAGVQAASSVGSAISEGRGKILVTGQGTIASVSTVVASHKNGAATAFPSGVGCVSSAGIAFAYDTSGTSFVQVKQVPVSGFTPGSLANGIGGFTPSVVNSAGIFYPGSGVNSVGVFK